MMTDNMRIALDEPLRTVCDVATEGEGVALLEQVALPTVPVADFRRTECNELGSRRAENPGKPRSCQSV